MNLVYTAIYGDYDQLIQPKHVTDGWDYVCYSDKEFDGGEWQVRRWDIDLDPARASKYVKIKHPILDYKNILWVDATIEIFGDLNDFLRELPDGDLVIPRHPHIRRLKDELNACKILHKDDKKTMEEQVASYGELDYVFTQNTVILRRADLTTAMDIWMDEIIKHSRRDQLSFGYSMLMAGQKYSTYPLDVVLKYMKWHSHTNRK